MERQRQYVGIDLHRRRSVIVRRDDDGSTLSCVRVDNVDLDAFSAEIAAAGEHPEVVLEATYGWVRHERRMTGRGEEPRLRPVAAGR